MARKAYTSEEVAKRMETLPEATADFLYSSEMSGIIKGIADRYSLHIDQMGLLEAETGQLILGLTEPQNFAPYIAESLKISAEQAATVAKDINEEVISKLRASMGQPSGEVLLASKPLMPKTPVAPASSPEVPAPSVMMPSSAKPIVPAASAPLAVPSAPTPPTAAAPAPKLAAMPDLGAAEAMLNEKRVVPPTMPAAPATPATNPVSKIDPAQPQNYKADPYREPVE